MTREEFLVAAEIAFEKLMTPTRGIAFSRLEEPMHANGASFKDLAAHLVRQHTHLLRALEALYQGCDPLSVLSEMAGEEMADARTQAQAQPVKRVLSELRLAHSTLTEAVRRLPDERLPEAEIPAWLVTHVLERYARHTPEVESWAARLRHDGEDRPQPGA